MHFPIDFTRQTTRKKHRKISRECQINKQQKENNNIVKTERRGNRKSDWAEIVGPYPDQTDGQIDKPDNCFIVSSLSRRPETGIEWRERVWQTVGQASRLPVCHVACRIVAKLMRRKTIEYHLTVSVHPQI